MPVDIMAGLLALLVALVLYTIGTFGAFKAKTMRRKDVNMIFVAFVFDLATTGVMSLATRRTYGTWLDFHNASASAHTLIALAGMIGMLAFGVLGYRALKAGQSRTQASLGRWILAPWALWVAVFAWGMVTRMPKRG